jgi:hypothetical protein
MKRSSSGSIRYVLFRLSPNPYNDVTRPLPKGLIRPHLVTRVESLDRPFDGPEVSVDFWSNSPREGQRHINMEGYRIWMRRRGGRPIVVWRVHRLSLDDPTSEGWRVVIDEVKYFVGDVQEPYSQFQEWFDWMQEIDSKDQDESWKDWQW